jgi:hypothetical protein
MPLWDGDEIRALHRIAKALEGLLELARDAFEPPTPRVRSVDLMSIPTGPIAPGDTGTFLATAADANGNPVPTAVPVVASSDETILSITSDGAAGNSTITYTGIADGAAQVTGSFTNLDGSVADTGAGNPATFTVATPAAAVTAVNFA